MPPGRTASPTAAAAAATASSASRLSTAGPDNANLDKARRLLWPIKKKYGRKISWADLLVLAGNVAMESMGFKTFGFGFGRPDVWEPEEIFWGPEDTWLGDERYSGDRELARPFGVQMGLIYVNPEGPGSNPNGSRSGGKKVSLADLIVLGGCTDVDTFEVLEPAGDGFRNYMRAEDPLSPETRLLDRANLLKLTAPEMTVLVGGMRALNANHGQSKHGVFTDRPGTLTNDFFVNLLDVGTAWRPAAKENVYEGRDRATGAPRWTATAADLVFGAHSQLRALAEVYASDDAKEKFARTSLRRGRKS